MSSGCVGGVAPSVLHFGFIFYTEIYQQLFKKRLNASNSSNPWMEQSIGLRPLSEIIRSIHDLFQILTQRSSNRRNNQDSMKYNNRRNIWMWWCDAIRICIIYERIISVSREKMLMKNKPRCLNRLICYVTSCATGYLWQMWMKNTVWHKTLTLPLKSSLLCM